MKVLIQTLGSAGDTYPFIGIGAELERRGHEVVLFANEVFRSSVVDAGLGFVEMGDADSYERLAENPDVWNSRRGLELIFRAVSEHLEESIELIEGELDSADVLVSSSLGFGARLVRDIHGIPLVTAHLAPSLFRSTRRLPRTEIMLVRDGSPEWAKQLWWRVGDALVDRLVLTEINRIRKDRGLGEVSRVLREWAVYSPDITLGLFPDWFGPPQPDWSQEVHLTGFPLYDDASRGLASQELQGWLTAAERSVIFTAGSANQHARGFFEAALDVSQRLGIRGLLVTSNDADVPDELPQEVRHVSYAPFGELLPNASALVSHGGVGTAAQALAAGIPHLVAHVNFDQRDNGSRISDLGAGDHLPMRRFSGTTAKTAVESLFDGDVRARAKSLADMVDGARAIGTAADAVESALVRV